MFYCYPILNFPDFPDVVDCLPLDNSLNLVSDNKTTVEYILVPFSIYKSIVNYKLNVDIAETEYKTFIDNL